MSRPNLTTDTCSPLVLRGAAELEFTVGLPLRHSTAVYCQRCILLLILFLSVKLWDHIFEFSIFYHEVATAKLETTVLMSRCTLLSNGNQSSNQLEQFCIEPSFRDSTHCVLEQMSLISHLDLSMAKAQCTPCPLKSTSKCVDILL